MFKLFFLTCLSFLSVILAADNIPEDEYFKQYYPLVDITKLASSAVDVEHNLSKFAQFVNESVGLQLDDNEEVTAVVNEFTEKLLSNLNAHVRENNKHFQSIPSKDVDFTGGWLKFTDGTINGLDSIQRKANVKVTYKYPEVNVDVPLGFKQLPILFKYHGQILLSSVSGKLVGDVVENRFTVSVSINTSTLKGKLNYFGVTNVGDVTLTAVGSGAYLINLGIHNHINGVKTDLKNNINRNGRKVVSGLINDYNERICEILNNCSY